KVYDVQDADPAASPCRQLLGGLGLGGWQRQQDSC
ncbi:hypothetical protein EE612_020956, partial [Oryza sativa]